MSNVSDVQGQSFAAFCDAAFRGHLCLAAIRNVSDVAGFTNAAIMQNCVCHCGFYWLPTIPLRTGDIVDMISV